MTHMLMARAIIDHTALEGIHVARMRFPYDTALDTFLSSILAISSRRQKRKQPFDPKEYPPFRRLNDALVATAPSLIHGFEEYGRDIHWEHRGIWQKPRQLLTLTQVYSDPPLWKPDIAQINDLVWVWAEQWAKDVFADEVSTRDGERALGALLHSIQNNAEGWTESIDASTLWSAHEQDNVAYSALPSIIAALFVEKSRLQPFTMGDSSKPIRWLLTQDGDKSLAVVSEPFSHNNGNDLLSYKVEFVLQTQPGRVEPWLAVYIRLRRWGSRPVTSKNYRRDVSVMLMLGSERKEGWPVNAESTMVRLRVSGSVSKGKLRWGDRLSELLGAWRARPLIDPNILFKAPGAYDGDTYLILHAEGMTYKGGKHSAKSGTTLRERTDLMKNLQTVMDGILTLDRPLPIDVPASLTVADIREQRLMALHSVEDMKKVQVDVPKGQTKRERRALQRQHTDKALDIARGSKPIHLLLITKESKPALERAVREALFLDEDESLPNLLRITSVRVPLELALPPGSEIPDGYARNQADQAQHQNTLTAEWEAKRRDWEALLRPHFLSNAHNLALIELSGKPLKTTEKDDWLKSAVRHACVQAGIVSQMMFTFPDRLYDYPNSMIHLPRIRNAIYDLLLRQTHVLYGSLAEVYQYAGLEATRAKELVLGGLYRERKNMTPRVAFPLYVELHPDGRVMVTLPDAEGNPLEPIPYLEASIKLGQLFCKPANENNQRLFNYRLKSGDNRMAHFVSGILKRPLQQQTLILMEADGWRQDGIFLTGNKYIKRDSLKIGNEILTPTSLPKVALLRVRDAGTLGETPQYVSSDAWDIQQFDSEDRIIGIIDHDSSESFLHYFSIGRQPPQDNTLYAFGDGGDKLFRHQQAIELIPFFGPDERMISLTVELLTYCALHLHGQVVTLHYRIHCTLRRRLLMTPWMCSSRNCE